MFAVRLSDQNNVQSAGGRKECRYVHSVNGTDHAGVQVCTKGTNNSSAAENGRGLHVAPHKALIRQARDGAVLGSWGFSPAARRAPPIRSQRRGRLQRVQVCTKGTNNSSAAENGRGLHVAPHKALIRQARDGAVLGSWGFSPAARRAPPIRSQRRGRLQRACDWNYK
uniref:Uncharacterized protein n=1 Tax=Branchiostoma floridae TaxID=7739 RepID=C3Y0A6_BRAFL|eukprot:XP_002610169.1 hypothetical protein BRAFLDRAFT_77073 [Branchiostoma floridae]